MFSIIFLTTILCTFSDNTEHLSVYTTNGVREFTVEIAKTRAEQMKGLMNRTEMAKDHGMIFIYNSPLQVR